MAPFKLCEFLHDQFDCTKVDFENSQLGLVFSHLKMNATIISYKLKKHNIESNPTLDELSKTTKRNNNYQISTDNVLYVIGCKLLYPNRPCDVTYGVISKLSYNIIVKLNRYDDVLVDFFLNQLEYCTRLLFFATFTKQQRTKSVKSKLPTLPELESMIERNNEMIMHKAREIENYDVDVYKLKILQKLYYTILTRFNMHNITEYIYNEFTNFSNTFLRYFIEQTIARYSTDSNESYTINQFIKSRKYKVAYKLLLDVLYKRIYKIKISNYENTQSEYLDVRLFDSVAVNVNEIWQYSSNYTLKFKYKLVSDNKFMLVLISLDDINQLLFDCIDIERETFNVSPTSWKFRLDYYDSHLKSRYLYDLVELQKLNAWDLMYYKYSMTFYKVHYIKTCGFTVGTHFIYNPKDTVKTVYTRHKKLEWKDIYKVKKENFKTYKYKRQIAETVTIDLYDALQLFNGDEF